MTTSLNNSGSLSTDGFVTPVPWGLPQPTEPIETHQVYRIAVAISVMGGVTVFCVLWRLWYRLRNKIFGLDDYSLVLAVLLYISWTTLGVHVNIHGGVGKPLWEITMREYSIWFKGIVCISLMYPVMTTATRVSILLFYLRMFETPVKSRYNAWSITIYHLLAAQFVYLVTFMILPVFISNPLHKAWTDPAHRTDWVDDIYYYKTQLALHTSSLIFDAILICLPIWKVSRLHMPIRRRIGVGLLLVLGGCAGLAAAIKLALFISEMSRFEDPASAGAEWPKYYMSSQVPPQFDQYGLTFWIPSQVEPSIALIGASIPNIRQSIVDTWKSCFPGKRQSLPTDEELEREDELLFDRIAAANSRRCEGQGRPATAPNNPDKTDLGGIKFTYTRYQTTHHIESSESIISEEVRNGMSGIELTPYPYTGTICTTKTVISSTPRTKRGSRSSTCL
ncbi:hypothetical protein V8F20_011506 [Naviculisporaceae sp. PSN 640]